MVMVRLPPTEIVACEQDGGSPPSPVDLLILGAGWTSGFLIPLLKREKIPYAATSTTGRDATITFKFDPTSTSDAPFRRLPAAKTVLITFPLKGEGQSKQLTSLYAQTHSSIITIQWIQLGSTGIFTAPGISNSRSPYDKTNARAIAEDELLDLKGCVLDLAGLYGGSRDPKNWLTRVAKSKDDVRKKGAVHLIHGEDVSRAVVAVHRKFTPGARWIVADLRTYDWWELMLSWADEANTTDGKAELDFRRWVGELMTEEDIRVLPREIEKLGRVLDSRDFWAAVGVWPIMSLRTHCI